MTVHIGIIWLWLKIILITLLHFSNTCTYCYNSWVDGVDSNWIGCVMESHINVNMQDSRYEVPINFLYVQQLLYHPHRLQLYRYRYQQKTGEVHHMSSVWVYDVSVHASTVWQRKRLLVSNYMLDFVATEVYDLERLALVHNIYYD